MKIGIVGVGVVGGAMYDVLEMKTKYDLAIFDGPKGLGHMDLMQDREIVFVCVWTPLHDGVFDESAVRYVVTDLDMITSDDTIIVIRSTVTPGTLSFLNMRARSPVIAAPEFLVQSDPIGSIRNADRIVIGGDEKDFRAMSSVSTVLEDLSPSATVMFCSHDEAALIKLMSNAMLAAKVTFANEFKHICDKLNADWNTVQTGVGLDSRIGSAHMDVTEEGGFGGKCLPKDLKALIDTSRGANFFPFMLESLQRANELYRKEERG